MYTHDLLITVNGINIIIVLLESKYIYIYIHIYLEHTIRCTSYTFTLQELDPVGDLFIAVYSCTLK